MWMTVDASFTNGVAGIAAVVWENSPQESKSKPVFVVGERVAAVSIMEAEYKALMLAVQLAKDGEITVQTDSKNIADSIQTLNGMNEWTQKHNINLRCVWAARGDNSVADAFASIAYRRGSFYVSMKGQP